MSSNVGNENLSKRFLGELLSYCSSNDRIDKVILFGSRARGDHRQNSDIDLAIQTNWSTHSDQNLIENNIQDMLTPLKIDIVFINRLAKKELMKNIKRDGVMLYEKGEALRKA